MDRTEVTNAQFAEFVAATGYRTLAERGVRLAADVQSPVVAGSAVFRPQSDGARVPSLESWWTFVAGASWREPDGPASSLEGREHHPVVHVAFEDAEAYARWAGKALPTEAEWEFAARGGLDGAEYVWGDELMPGGKPQANTWQGEFPWQNLLEDEFEWTAPVGSFAPNGYGLYDMAGNVWEWTTDWYQEHSKIEHACCTMAKPRGGAEQASYDPSTPGVKIPRKVMKGGSYLCAPNYCRRYRPAARMAQPIDTSTCHLGFRCVVRTAT
jgi:formylglycine-generating enzyme required for sulfatase activity